MTGSFPSRRALYRGRAGPEFQQGSGVALIEIPFDPDLALGPLRIAWHSIFGIAAGAAGVTLGMRLGARYLAGDVMYGIALAGLVGGVVGSRIFHVVDEWPRYAAAPLDSLALWNGGASITGGMVGGVLVAMVAAIRSRAPVRLVLDLGAPGLALGMAIGRIGDVVNGEHWATRCEGLPWCVRYTHPRTLGQSEPVHPAVAYELALDLAILALLLALFRAERLRGRLIFVLFGVYGLGRFLLAATRLDPLFALGLSQAQLLSLGFVLVAGVGLARKLRPIS